MKKLFYPGVLGLVLFEIANVYFIMPMPGSQEMESIGAAYFLHSWRWMFRALFGIMVVAGLKAAIAGSKWLPAVALLCVAGVIYATSFNMAADTMFYQPNQVLMKNAAENNVGKERLVIGVEHEGEARAYPIQFIGYHHQVCDTIAGKPLIATYCTVCRTGRVFEPVVEGRLESFRLVGMDHFNAMFEDKTTKSWWRQVTGEAVAGPLKGRFLPEMPSTQTSLGKWLELHPQSLVMQPDPAFQAEYDSMGNYEAGRRTGKLTRRDTASWQDKSWVAGIALGKESKAWDWNMLQQQGVVNDEVGNQPVALVLTEDESLFAFHRSAPDQQISIKNDTLSDGRSAWNLLGKSFDSSSPNLKRINAYQEYWHSWRTFHPETKQH